MWLLVHSLDAAVAASLFVVVARVRGVARGALLRFLGAVTLFHLCSLASLLLRDDARAAAVAAIWMTVALLGPTLLDALVEARRKPSPLLRAVVVALYAGSAAVMMVPFARGFQPSALYFVTVVPAMIVVLIAGLRDARGERGLFAISMALVGLLAIYAAGMSHAALIRMTTASAAVNTIGESLPVLLALTLAFYRYRFAFMDRFVPLAAAAMATAVCVSAVMAIGEGSPAILAAAILSIAVWNAMTRWVRERLFGRATLATLPADAQRLLGAAKTSDEMTRGVIDLLASRLRAPVSVDGTDCALAIPVDGRTLCFGARPHEQPYFSGDIAILQSVAGQLGAAIAALRQAELRELAARAELSAMRAQIQPHFLFNTLNTLAELVRSSPAAAELLVERLAEVFRYALASSRAELVTLGEEIEFVTAYLAIEEARFEERLRVAIEIPSDCAAVRIPPMSLQPIVENAIRHRISRAPDGGSVTIRASRGAATLRIEVRDESAALDEDDRSRGSGIGLENVRKRLLHLFGESARLERVPHGATGSTVTLQVPL